MDRKECRLEDREENMSKNTNNVLVLEKDSDSGEYFLPLDKILAGTNVDPDEVAYYELEEKKSTVILKLYDKNKKHIKVKQIKGKKDMSKYNPFEFDWLEIYELIEKTGLSEYRVDPRDTEGLNSSKKLRKQYLETYPFLKLRKSKTWKGEYMVSLDEAKWEKDHKSQAIYYKQKVETVEKDLQKLKDKLKAIINAVNDI